jgi:hypothetical protein
MFVASPHSPFSASDPLPSATLWASWRPARTACEGSHNRGGDQYTKVYVPSSS